MQIPRESPMERFVIQQNIERYRKLLDTTDEPQRRVIFKLLTEEEEKLSRSQEPAWA